MPTHITSRVDKLPSFTPLSTPEDGAYRVIMQNLGHENASLDTLRDFSATLESAERFSGWLAVAASGIVVPDYTLYEAEMFKDGTQLRTDVQSDVPFRHPHPSVASRVAGKILRRSNHGHHHEEWPGAADTTRDVATRDYWMISEKENSSIYNSATVRSKWLIGEDRGQIVGRNNGRTGLYDNNDGRTDLKPGLNRVQQTTRLRRLDRLVNEPGRGRVLPPNFTAAHVANRAARIATSRGIDPSRM